MPRDSSSGFVIVDDEVKKGESWRLGGRLAQFQVAASSRSSCELLF